MRVVPALAGAWATSITRYWPAATFLSLCELSLEVPSESEMLPEDAEPALDADEATLSAWTGDAQAAARVARQSMRARMVLIMEVFRKWMRNKYGAMVLVRRTVEKAAAPPAGGFYFSLQSRPRDACASSACRSMAPTGLTR
jgi:hypothetical protein